MKEQDFSKERERLDQMASVYHSEKALGPDRIQKQFCLERVAPQLHGPNVLELSYNDGLWTDAMLALGFSVTIVEGAEDLINGAKARYAGNPSVTCVHALFEEYEPQEAFDDVLMPYILEHVIEPIDLLQRAARAAKPSGALHVLVPNGPSLHRRVGVAMGLIPDLDYLDTTDLEVGHRRQYTREMLLNHIREAGLEPLFCEGVFLKPLNSGLMMDWPIERLRGFNALSSQLPDYCAFLYAKAVNQGEG